MDGKFYVCSKFSDVTLHTLRYGSTHTASMVRYSLLCYIMLREGGKLP